MNPRTALFIGRALGVVAGLAVQALVVAPALAPNPLVFLTFIALVIVGLVAGDRATRLLVHQPQP